MIETDTTTSQRNSHTAAALHALLQAATRAARTDAAPPGRARPRKVPRRITAAAAWAQLQALHPRTSVDRTLTVDRAVRRILAALLEETGRSDAESNLDHVDGPVLVIRSGPWPVLRSLLVQLKDHETARPLTVLCHHRDESGLLTLGRDLGLDLEPLFYPRFEPFNTSTLRRLLDGGPWRSTFVLDASKAGRGDALEHVTTAVSSTHACIWNAGGTAWRQRSLRERLDAEGYALVRGLLRWRARTEMDGRPA